MSKIIHLRNGGYALVDDDDFSRLSKYAWRRDDRGYVVRTINKPKLSVVTMHRDVVSCPTDYVIDHMNHNQCDNRKKNLRVATVGQNQFNRQKRIPKSSIYKGVSKNTHRGWQARIVLDGKCIHLGTYQTEKEAALAYDIKAVELYGDFAYLNANMEGFRDE